MTLTTRRGGRALAAVLAPHLDRWAQQRAVLGELHSGDLGWHLRFPDERVAGSVLVWEKDGEPVAAGLLDGQDLLPAVSPEHAASEELAAAMATTSAGLTSVDASDGTLLRDVLLGQGWTVDPLEWVVLLADLGPGHATDQDPGTRELDGPADVEARVAVQRSAFSPGSTFTAALWEQMASGPTYDRRFDLVTWTPDGRPAAAATGWFAGPGRTAILEPVGTHADHRRQGYGGRVNLAVMAALARAGASAVRVHTPASNPAAVGAYESCGLRRVNRTTAVTRTG
ncbi:MAG: GNAT family N-acetyltransferase [Nocardioidaceae bacterium]